MKPSIFVSLLLFAQLSVVVSAAAADAAPVFKVYLEHTGVYELTFERLESAGLETPTPSAAIGLRSHGEPHPVWVEDGGDGVFGPGDRLLFVGEVLRGEYSYLDPYSRFNCYVLDCGDPSPLRGSDLAGAPDSNAGQSDVVSRYHLEPDRVLVRFRPRSDRLEEEWYWQRLSVADKKPFTQALALEGLRRQGGARKRPPDFANALLESVRAAEPDSARILSQLDAVFGEAATQTSSVRLRMSLRGWSEPRHRERDALPHHHLEVELNGRPVESAVWDGVDHHVYEIEVPSSLLVDGDNDLSMKILKRSYPESGDLVVDVVLLNWIELEYLRQPRVGEEQIRLRLADPEAGGAVRITADGGGPVDLYLRDGIRVRGVGEVAAQISAGGEAGFSVLGDGAAAAPDEVVLDRPSNLADPDQQADYIMITHRTLADGAHRLADFHRSRGLTVAVVDVQDIYDEFNHGILDPRAIRDFLEHAHGEWRLPAPRFVLLIGDASWDFKNITADDQNYADWTYRPGEGRRFSKNGSTRYAEGADLNHRNLVPTSSYTTLEGHAASDTWLVCFDDGDDLPDMAIGRIPAINSEELDGVIEKTIAFASSPPVGPWRRNLLFIANESVGFQKRSDRIADDYSRRGYVPTKIYPHPSEPANEAHTQRIIEQFDKGLFAIHFIGHGGRYIWRTGPPDLEKNHDLFTLDHLDELADNHRLPVVLSLTCYSAPFDHPTADSIGEKLMRMPDRGAIAVFAASWRNSPTTTMGERLLEELTMPGNTIGEAVMRAKRDFRSQVLVQTYNLLGDPAVPVAVPSASLDLALDVSDDGVVLSTVMPAAVDNGTLIADWMAADGRVLRTDRVGVTGTDFELKLDAGVLDGEDELSGVRVYVWDEEQRIDGIGWVGLATAEDENGLEAAKAASDAEVKNREESS